MNHCPAFILWHFCIIHLWSKTKVLQFTGIVCICYSRLSHCSQHGFKLAYSEWRKWRPLQCNKLLEGLQKDDASCCPCPFQFWNRAGLCQMNSPDMSTWPAFTPTWKKLESEILYEPWLDSMHCFAAVESVVAEAEKSAPRMLAYKITRNMHLWAVLIRNTVKLRGTIEWTVITTGFICLSILQQKWSRDYPPKILQ